MNEILSLLIQDWFQLILPPSNSLFSNLSPRPNHAQNIVIACSTPCSLTRLCACIAKMWWPLAVGDRRRRETGASARNSAGEGDDPEPCSFSVLEFQMIHRLVPHDTPAQPLSLAQDGHAGPVHALDTCSSVRYSHTRNVILLYAIIILTQKYGIGFTLWPSSLLYIHVTLRSRPFHV